LLEDLPCLTVARLSARRIARRTIVSAAIECVSHDSVQPVRTLIGPRGRFVIEAVHVGIGIRWPVPLMALFARVLRSVGTR
jgi:hypothetical protein